MILDFNQKLPGLPASVKVAERTPAVRTWYMYLVLGGGGMKGLAHVGAWRALQETGVRVTGVVGTSIGALIGACIAGGLEYERMVALARALQKPDVATLNRWALLFNGIRQPSLFRDEPFRAYLESVLPARTFGELDLPLSVNAVDLTTGETKWFGAGGDMDVPLADAIYASCALPVFYPPAQIDGHYYVDGGVGDPLPIDFAAAQGASRIIAIDVAAGMVGDGAGAVDKGMVAIHHRVMQIMGGLRRRASLGSDAIDGLETGGSGDVYASGTERGSDDPHGSGTARGIGTDLSGAGARASGADVVYVRPELDGYETFDFANTEYFLAEGYRAVQAALGGAVPPREQAV
jgi:predicted acylesterase/phospholipase RssA